MEYIKLIIILLLSYLLRRPFIIAKSSDVGVHLWHIKKSKICGFGQHYAFKSVFNGNKGYPSFPHYILSLFPEKSHIRIGYLLNIIYDCISIFIIYLISKIFLFKNIVSPTAQYIEPQLMATILYATAPILLPYTSRLKSFGGRTFGNLLNIIYFSTLGICMLSNNYFFLILAVFSGIMIVLSSAFGMQVMISFSIILSILYLSFTPVLTLAFVFIIGISLPFLGIRDIARFKLNHYIWYKKNYEKGTEAADRNKLIDFIFYPIYLFTDRKKFFQLSFKKLTPVIIVYSLPALLFLIYWLLRDYDQFYNLIKNDLIQYLFYISIASLVVFAITSLKWFSFLGEAERYFEYSAGAITLLFVAFCYTYGLYNFLFYVLILHICFIQINFLASIKKNMKKSIKIEEDKYLNEIVEFLNSKEKCRILSIPTKLNFRLSFYTKNSLRFYYHFIEEGKVDGFKKQQQDEVIYNYVKPDFEYFNNKYKIDTIVADKNALKVFKKKYSKDYDFSNLKLLFENEEYLVYRF